MSVADTEAADPVAPAVVARGIAMTGRWGTVFGPLDLAIPTGGVTVLVGPKGLGCTALLLTLAGRMRPLRGTVTVLGKAGASQIFRTATPAAIGDLDTVTDSVTVTDVVTEQMRWNAPWYRAVHRAGGREVDAMCRSVFGSLPSPPGSAFVGELSELDRVLLRIALANSRWRPLLVVGSLHQVSSRWCRDLLLWRLADLGRSQTVITAAPDEVSNECVRAQIRVGDPAAGVCDGQAGE
jgi:energy-coupling factor transporter ATP-binding protein EcfA2